MSATDLPPHDKLALAIGKVTIAWNGAHETLFDIFHRVTAMTPDAADAVFFSIKSDRGQRDLVRKAAAVILSNSGRASELQELTAYIKELDRMAEKRNTSIHTMWHGLLRWDADGRRIVMKPRTLRSETESLATLEVPDYERDFRQLAADIQGVGLKLFDLWRRL